MTTTQYLRAFVRFWWVIVIGVALGVVLSLVAASGHQQRYTSSVAVLFSGTPPTQPSTAEAYQATQLALQRMPTYSDLASSTTLAERVLESGGTSLTPAQLASRTTTVVQGGSTVLRIQVEDTDATRAQQLADLDGSAMVKLVRALETRQTQAGPLLQARVVGAATSPTPVDEPSIWRNPLLGGLAGLLVALALAVALSRTAPRLRDQDAVAAAAGAPVLGLVPARGRRAGRPSRRRRTSRGSAYEEAVEQVRTAVYFLREDLGRCLALSFTSPGPVAALPGLVTSLAASLADTGTRVLVVETSAAESRLPPDGTWPQVAEGVDVVQAPSEDTDRWAHSPEFARLLEEAADVYDYVLVDTPSTSAGVQAAACAAQCDATVVVVASGTRESLLQDSLRRLQSVDAQVRGVVLVS